MPTLSNFWWVLNPGVSLSTMKAVMPLLPAEGFVFAYCDGNAEMQTCDDV